MFLAKRKELERYERAFGRYGAYRREGGSSDYVLLVVSIGMS
jgi:hypothetical protein